MGSKYEKLVKLTAKKFDKKRKKLLPTDISFSLLTKDGLTGNYLTVINILSGWWFYYDGYREQTKVQIATLDQDFEEAFLKSSDMIIDSTIFQIDKRDYSRPDGKRHFWQIAGSINPENR